MSARAKLPAHGTPARYRLELKNRREGRTDKPPCDRCRAAENERRRNRRTNPSKRPVLTVVGDGHPQRTSAADTPPPTPTEEKRHPSGRRRKRAGKMELAVEKDLAAIDENLRVPFHESLSVLAIELASEIDEPATTAPARRDARKQLFDVLRSLRTSKEGEDGSALDVLLQERGFGTPLVPHRPA